MEIDNVKDCIEVKIHAGLVIDNKTFELCMIRIRWSLSLMNVNIGIKENY